MMLVLWDAGVETCKKENETVKSDGIHDVIVSNLSLPRLGESLLCHTSSEFFSARWKHHAGVQKSNETHRTPLLHVTVDTPFSMNRVNQKASEMLLGAEL